MRSPKDFQSQGCRIKCAQLDGHNLRAEGPVVCLAQSNGLGLLKKMESVIPRAESWLLGDQYDETVVAPKFDLEAWERENGQIVK